MNQLEKRCKISTNFERSFNMRFGESHIEQTNDGGAIENPGCEREVVNQSTKTARFRNQHEPRDKTLENTYSKMVMKL